MTDTRLAFTREAQPSETKRKEPTMAKRKKKRAPQPSDLPISGEMQRILSIVGQDRELIRLPGGFWVSRNGMDQREAATVNSIRALVKRDRLAVTKWTDDGREKAVGITNSFKAEVIADSSGKWTSSKLRFVTRAAAESYVRDLAGRWTLVTDTRVVPSNDLVSEGKIIRLFDNVESYEHFTSVAHMAPRAPEGWAVNAREIDASPDGDKRFIMTAIDPADARRKVLRVDGRWA